MTGGLLTTERPVRGRSDGPVGARAAAGARRDTRCSRGPATATAVRLRRCRPEVVCGCERELYAVRRESARTAHTPFDGCPETRRRPPGRLCRPARPAGAG